MSFAQVPSQHLISLNAQVLIAEQRIYDLAQAPFGQFIIPSGHFLSTESLQWYLAVTHYPSEHLIGRFAGHVI